MTRDQAITLVLARLGQRQLDTVLQAAAVLEMNAAQERLEGGEFKPWFLLSEFRAVDTSPNEERIALPSDFLMEPDEGAMWRTTTDSAFPLKELVKTDYDLGKARYPTPSVPLKYSIGGKYLFLHPTPDAAYTLKTRFYLKDVQITDAYLVPGVVTTNLWLTYASDWLMAEVGTILATLYTRDAEAAGIFVAQATAGRNRVRTETVARQEANQSRQMGED